MSEETTFYVLVGIIIIIYVECAPVAYTLIFVSILFAGWNHVRVSRSLSLSLGLPRPLFFGPLILYLYLSLSWSPSFASGLSFSVSLSLPKIHSVVTSSQRVRLFPTCNCLNAANKYWPRILILLRTANRMPHTTHQARPGIQSLTVLLWHCFLCAKRNDPFVQSTNTRARVHRVPGTLYVRTVRTLVTEVVAYLLPHTKKNNNNHFLKYPSSFISSGSNRFGTAGETVI